MNGCSTARLRLDGLSVKRCGIWLSLQRLSLRLRLAADLEYDGGQAVYPNG